MAALKAAAAAAQESSDKYLTDFDPDVPHAIVNEHVIWAWYEFANLLTWARGLEDRLDRKGHGLPHRQGLVPAIKPARLRTRTEGLLIDLRSGPMKETRFLANFTLHSALVRSPSSGAKLDGHARLTMPIPDQPVSPIQHWKLLTWHDKRDGLVFAEELWSSIESFMDDLIAAFENAVPRRLRRDH